MTPNKALQATAAGLCGAQAIGRHNAVVAGRSAPPAAVPEIMLAADFPDHVLWETTGGPIAPEQLPLATGTCDLLWEWYRWWSEIYLTDDYRRDSTAEMDWLLFDIRGVEIWKQLRSELSGRYEVVYYSERLGEHFDEPEKLDALLHSRHIA